MTRMLPKNYFFLRFFLYTAKRNFFATVSQMEQISNIIDMLRSQIRGSSATTDTTAAIARKYVSLQMYTRMPVNNFSNFLKNLFFFSTTIRFPHARGAQYVRPSYF